MGMFDELICKMPLPSDVDPDLKFQTKSLDKTLSLYIINEQGQLEDHGFSLESEEEESTPIRDPEIIDHHGYVTFFTMVYDQPRSKAYTWHEYEAKFTDGICVAIERIPCWRTSEDGTRIYDEGYDKDRPRK